MFGQFPEQDEMMDRRAMLSQFGAPPTERAMPRMKIPGPAAYGPPVPANERMTEMPIRPTPAPQASPVAQAAVAAARDSSKWDTDGYARPGFTAENFGNAPAGFDMTKWGNADHQTPKYVLGRIVNAYAKDGRIDLGGMEKAFADIQRAYPGSTWSGKDKVTVPGVGEVDLVKGMSDDGMGEVQYGVAGAGGGGQGGGIGGVASALAHAMKGSGIAATPDSNAIQELIARLQAEGNHSVDQDAMRALLGGA